MSSDTADAAQHPCAYCGAPTDGTQTIGTRIVCAKPECMHKAVAGEVPGPTPTAVAEPDRLQKIIDRYQAHIKTLEAKMKGEGESILVQLYDGQIRMYQQFINDMLLLQRELSQ